MPLIKCPDCGKEVSDRAPACPFCGCPVERIADSGTIAIKLSVLGKAKQKVIISSDSETLWSGYAGEVAEFNLSKPTEICIKYVTNLLVWGIEFKQLVDPSKGKKYAVQLIRLSVFGKPKNAILTKVDVIDSER